MVCPAKAAEQQPVAGFLTPNFSLITNYKMTTAQKKKLLQMPSIQGELLITNSYGNRMTYPFGDIFKYRRDYAPNKGCIMIGKEQSHYMSADDKNIRIWQVGYGGYEFDCKIPYKHVHILWCHYKGENNIDEN